MWDVIFLYGLELHSVITLAGNMSIVVVAVLMVRLMSHGFVGLVFSSG